jgi:hypothetical protein
MPVDCFHIQNSGAKQPASSSKICKDFDVMQKRQARKMLIKVKKKIISTLLWGSIFLLFASNESVHLNGYTDNKGDF